MRIVGTLGLVLLLLTSCKKEAGLGGLAKIRGKLFATDITTSGIAKDSGYLGNERIFISVSGNPVYFTDTRSSYDGSFEFKYLREGTYDVWAYSDCDTCVWKQQKVLISGINISEKKQIFTIPDLRIIF